MSEHHKALRLARVLVESHGIESFEGDAAAELRRLYNYEAAFNGFMNKTEWVQQTIEPGELGVHRADILRQRIEAKTHELNRSEHLLGVLTTALQMIAEATAHSQRDGCNQAHDLAVAALKNVGMNASTEIKPCPFCGHPADLDDPDTLYPNGTGWKNRRDGMKSYHSFRDVPREQWCYSIHCVTTSGGCGAEISGDSRQECIDKWNSRA